jgi:TolA-binding protein
VRARRNAIVVLCALSLSAGVAAAAAAEPGGQPDDGRNAKEKIDAPNVKDGLLERPAERLYRTIETTEETQRLEQAYDRLVERARDVGVSAANGPSAGDSTPTVEELDRAVEGLREKVREAEQAASPAESGAVAGIPTATLEAIAACESGGDPTAVSADGTYRGKYQFDTGTWASVGGTGDPAAAPEAEQDYRAALLYARSGTSSWPNCG